MNALLRRYSIEIAWLCRRFAVRRLEAFGSAVNGAFWDDTSDVDFLVAFKRPTSQAYADQYFGLKEALEALLGRSVNLVVASAIKNPYFRQSVDGNRVLLYAA